MVKTKICPLTGKKIRIIKILKKKKQKKGEQQNTQLIDILEKVRSTVGRSLSREREKSIQFDLFEKHNNMHKRGAPSLNFDLGNVNQ